MTRAERNGSPEIHQISRRKFLTNIMAAGAGAALELWRVSTGTGDIAAQDLIDAIHPSARAAGLNDAPNVPAIQTIPYQPETAPSIAPTTESAQHVSGLPSQQLLFRAPEPTQSARIYEGAELQELPNIDDCFLDHDSNPFKLPICLAGIFGGKKTEKDPLKIKIPKDSPGITGGTLEKAILGLIQTDPEFSSKKTGESIRHNK